MTVSADAKLAFVREQIVLPDGRTVGDALAGGDDPWVETDLLTPCFATDDDGLPMHSLVYLEVGRGSWKTGGLGAVAVAEAVLEEDTDVVVAAGDVDQAGIVLAQVDGYLRRNERLGAMFTARGNERLAEGGSRIRVISSDAPTAWGLGGTHRRFRVFCDELTVWRSGDLWAALASSTGKVKDAQTVIASNAGFDQGVAWQWKVRESARTEPWGYLYSPDGIRASWISPEWIEQQRALLPGPTFSRVIENRWSSTAGDFVTAAQWAACVDAWRTPRVKGSGRFFAGLDLGLTRDRTALAVVHHDGESVVLDELLVWQGSKDEPVSIAAVERAVADASLRFPGLTISADPWQLQGSIERLRQQRVRISEHVFSAGSVQKLSTTLYGAISSGKLRVFPDAELEREVLGLRVVESAGGWRFDHRAGGFSDRAVALAMAVQLAQKHPVRRSLRIGNPARLQIAGVGFGAERPTLDDVAAQLPQQDSTAARLGVGRR